MVKYVWEHFNFELKIIWCILNGDKRYFLPDTSISLSSRFDEKYGKFLKWQNIKVDAPTRTEFALLPSEELLLYVLTQNPVSQLIVYIYEGISGFNEKMIGSLVPNVQHMNQFSIQNDHFIALQNNDEINILRGMFKGHNFT